MSNFLLASFHLVISIFGENAFLSPGESVALERNESTKTFNFRFCAFLTLRTRNPSEVHQGQLPWTKPKTLVGSLFFLTVISPHKSVDVLQTLRKAALPVFGSWKPVRATESPTEANSGPEQVHRGPGSLVYESKYKEAWKQIAPSACGLQTCPALMRGSCRHSSFPPSVNMRMSLCRNSVTLPRVWVYSICTGDLSKIRNISNPRALSWVIRHLLPEERG